MLKLDWSDVEAMAGRLAEDIAAKHGPFGPDAVLVGVSRGGLIPAALVAHRLGVRKVAALGLMSYADGPDGTQGALVPYGPAPDTAAIVIDDIIDTGRTLEAVRARYPGAVIGALVDKTGGRSGAIAARETPAGLWVAFPWERD
ncbi:MAG: phosphoribosyltransferase [Oceanicaulis sp.]